MKAISKKLLSLLVVIAMVLSMVPFGGLSIFAVETKAATTTTTTEEKDPALTADVEALIAKGKQVKADAEKMQTDNILAGGNITAICPVCGESVTWKDLNAKIGDTTAFDSIPLANQHYYLSDDLTCTTTDKNSALSGAYSGTVGTLHLNGKNITSTIAAYMGGAGTTNIIGSGTVTTTNTGVSSSFGTIWLNSSRGASVLNLYGGTFVKGTSVTTRAVANISSNGGTINLYEGATIDGNNVTTNTAYAGSVHLDGKGLDPDPTKTTGDAVFNMYGGTIQNGKASAANARDGGNVRVSTAYSSFNMYAGSVSGGSANNGGNIYAVQNAKVIIANDASISGGIASKNGGNIFTSEDIDIYGDISNGQADEAGGNIFINTSSAVVKIKSAANIQGGQGQYGGSICVYGTCSLVVDGGEISGGNATNQGGGNVYLTGTGTLTMNSGKISGGRGKNGGNIFSQNAAADIDINGGEISGGNATNNGGNLYVVKCSDLQIVEIVGIDTLITDGTAAKAGGNLYMEGVTCNIGEGVTISEGKATTYGGNIHAQQNGTEGKEDALYSSITTAGKIIDGQLTDGSVLTAAGGNISITARTTLTVNGGEIARGVLPAKTDSASTQTGWGGNIRAWNSNVTINGGSIYAGDQAKQCSSSNKTAANIGCMGDAAHKELDFVKLTVTGGTITGDIMISATQTSVFVSDDAKIVKSAKINGITYTANYNGLFLSGDSQVTVGSLNDGAEICVSGSLNRKINVAAASVEAQADHFTAYDANRQILWNAENNVLYIAEKVAEPDKDVFDPESFGGKAYCPVCGNLENWTAVSGVTTLAAGHYYLSDNIESDSASAVLTAAAAAGETTCLHLNGKNITTAATATAGLVLHGTGAGTLNITGEGTEILNGKTNNTAHNGRAVQWDAGILNIYTGTITRTGYRAVVLQTGGVINQRGGTIDGTGPVYNWYGGGVWMTGGEYNMYDGATIQNGKGTTAGGNVTLYGEANCTFNMYGGTVKDGEAKDAATSSRAYQQGNGGNFYLRAGNRLNLYGGTVSGGKAYGDYYDATDDGNDNNGSSYGYGGNIYSYGTVTIGDGEATGTEITISGGKAGSWGGNIYCLSGSTLNIQAGALITGGDTTDATYGTDDTATRNYGGNISVGGSGVVYMSGGTVTGGTSNRGGNFDLAGAGTLNITGGTVSDGTSNSGGGNIFFQNGSAKVTISGSNTEISGGEAPSGGSIRASGGTLKIQGGIISGGTATGSVANSGLGGNIYISSATMEMTDGTITGGTANWIATDNGDSSFTYKNGDGGNIYSTNGTLTIKGGTISNGTAGQNGGNIMVSGGSFTVLAADRSKPVQFIGGLTKLWHGGNLCLNSATVSIYGAQITGGTAGDGEDYNALDKTTVYHGTTGQGGNMRIYNCQELVLKNSTVSGGSAVGGNPNVWIYQSTVTLENTQVVGNDGVFRGSGVTVGKSGDTLTIKGTTSITNADNNALRMVNGGTLVVEAGWSGNAGIYLEEKAYSVDETVNNASCTGAYTGTLMNSNGDKVAIIADGNELVLVGYAYVDVSGKEAVTTWASLEDALAAADDSDTVYLLAGANVALNGETVYIDALKDIEVIGTGTAYAIDPANAGFTTASTGKITGEIVKNDATFDGMRYIRISDGTAHAIEMRLSTVTLRTNNQAGLYYKAKYKCDDTLAAAIDGYGVALSVHDMPGVEFALDNDNFTWNDGKDFVPNEKHEVDTNSGGVFGILKGDNSQETNQKNLMTEIYANAYIMIGEEIFVADTENCGQKAGTAYSLYEVLAAINDNYSNYSEGVQEMVANFYNTWNGTGKGKVNFEEAFSATTNYSGEMNYSFEPSKLAAIAAKAAELAAQV